MARESGTKRGGPLLGVAELYRLFGAMVYRRALSLLKDPEEARDVTHDVFLDMVRRSYQVKSEPEGFALLQQIASFKAISQLRRRARWSGRLLHVFTAEVELAEGGEDGMRRIELAMDLALLTHGESPQALTVAVLRYVDGCQVKDVCEALDITPATVRRLLQRFVERAQKRSRRLEGRPE